ncbi:uncharacterized protein MYCFIDRAFT_169788 [Pseudocercospora fijiensis CIRAD86]|uniref:Uncharacterized protein n=1 Tax=Pseudocercospora fijiensis (strain CIRAD86) TaxID=383855 RepID=N1QAQ7_PSEFD|nr:uncharacterized protein MYCFIDRAFT_169788 [Pseudocercospora fijiensis CIRAD86]EME88087.1 hypothetical protein MYCFIDRAFT_169788 [Pseudocercospora fijiensis CIRAD86]
MGIRRGQMAKSRAASGCCRGQLRSRKKANQDRWGRSNVYDMYKLFGDRIARPTRTSRLARDC